VAKDRERERRERDSFQLVDKILLKIAERANDLLSLSRRASLFCASQTTIRRRISGNIQFQRVSLGKRKVIRFTRRL